MSVRKILFGYASRFFLYLAIGTVVGGNGCNGQKLKKQFVYTMADGSHGTITVEYKSNSVMKDNKKLDSYFYIVQYFHSDEAISKAMGEISGENSLPDPDPERIVESTLSPEEYQQLENDYRAFIEKSIDKKKIEKRAQLNDEELKEYAHRTINRDKSYRDAVVYLKPEERPYFKRVYTDLQQLKTGVIKIAFYDEEGHSLFRTGYGTTFTPASFVGHTYESNRIEDGLEWKGQFGESYITFENFCDIHSVKVEYIQ